MLRKLSYHPVFHGSSLATKSTDKPRNLSKIVSRGDDELFIANGKCIRCCDVSYKEDSYKILKLDGITGDIQCIKINDSGTLLAIYDGSKLIVSSLPTPGFMENLSSESIPVKKFCIGLGYFKSIEILDFIWNPIARFDSELVILSSNNYITTWDLTIGTELASTEINLSADGFGLDTTVVDPVSITFGSLSQTNPSLCLTLYILSVDGDIYAVYPFTPSCLAVSQEFVNKLFDETTLALNNSTTKRILLLQQLKYVSCLLKDISKLQKEVKLDMDGNVTQLYHIIPPTMQQQVKIQGLFRIAPFPDVLYNYESCQIDHVPCGGSEVIITSWTNGSVLMLFQDQDLVMRWKLQSSEDDVEGDDDEELTLSSLQYIALTQNQPDLIRLVGLNPALAPYQYFVVLNDSKLIKIDFSNWGKLLNDSVESNSPELLVDALDKGAELTLLSKELEQEGMCIIGSEDKAYIVKLGRVNVDVIEIETVKEATTSDDLTLKSAVLQMQRKKELLKTTDYENLLGSPYSELTATLNELKKKVPLPPLQTNVKLPISVSDEKCLKDVLELTKYVVHERMGSLNKFGIALQFRVWSQLRELRSQVSKLNDEFSDEKLEGYNEKNELLNERLLKLITKQSTANERLDGLLSKIDQLQRQQKLQTKNAVLSKQEQNWVQQIDKFEFTIKSLESKYQGNQQQLHYIKNFVYTNGISYATKSGKIDFKKFKKMLLDEQKLLDHISKYEITEVDELISKLSI